MKSETFTTLLLAILLGALVYLGCEQVFISRQILYRIGEVTNMSRSQTWQYKDAQGNLHSHTTTTVYRDSGHPGETIAEWKARFEAEVLQDERMYPPVIG